MQRSSGRSMGQGVVWMWGGVGRKGRVTERGKDGRVFCAMGAMASCEQKSNSM